jgi:hypothetical protein
VNKQIRRLFVATTIAITWPLPYAFISSVLQNTEQSSDTSSQAAESVMPAPIEDGYRDPRITKDIAAIDMYGKLLEDGIATNNDTEDCKKAERDLHTAIRLLLQSSDPAKKQKGENEQAFWEGLDPCPVVIKYKEHRIDAFSKGFGD